MPSTKKPMKKAPTGVGSMTPPKTKKVTSPIGNSYKADPNRPRAKSKPQR